MLECESRETGEQTFLEVPRSESAPVRRKGELHSPAADKADRPRSPARRRQLSVAAEGPYGRAASDGLGAASPSPRSLPHQGGGRRDEVLPELPAMGNRRAISSGRRPKLGFEGFCRQIARGRVEASTPPMRLIDQAIPSSVQYQDTLHQIAALDCRRATSRPRMGATLILIAARYRMPMPVPMTMRFNRKGRAH
jgi:hypothetical protein